MGDMATLWSLGISIFLPIKGLFAWVDWSAQTNKDLGHVHTFLHMKYNFLQNSCYTLELLQGFGVLDVYSVVQASEPFQKIFFLFR